MVSLSKKWLIVFGVWTCFWMFIDYARIVPEIVTVDVAAITGDFIQQEAQKRLSIQEKQKAVKRFSHQLEKALETLEHSKKHIIIFPKEAVLKGAKDYTKEVQSLIHLGT